MTTHRPDKVFHIYSMTKRFIALCAPMLAEPGKLSRNDEIMTRGCCPSYTAQTNMFRVRMSNAAQHAGKQAVGIRLTGMGAKHSLDSRRMYPISY